MSQTKLFVTLYALTSGFLMAFTGCGSSEDAVPSAHVSETSAQTKLPAKQISTTTQPSRAKAARQRASQEGKYLFAFFTKVEDDNTTAMRTVFQRAMEQASERAISVAVNVKDPAESEIVEEYGLARAPMPLVLAVAPNGAITGGFPTSFTEEELLSAFATPVTEHCMHALQAGKLVFLCVQNDVTKMNKEARQGVDQFADDERFRDATEIVTLDPCDDAEHSFLNDLQVDASTQKAVTVFLAPPGSPVAKYEGLTTKEQILADLQQAGACGPGGVCGPGGCGPQ